MKTTLNKKNPDAFGEMYFLEKLNYINSFFAKVIHDFRFFAP